MFDNPGLLTAISVVIVALLSGFWAWFAGRKKIEIDAQTAMLAGFTSLLSEFKQERIELKERITLLESENRVLLARVSQLELALKGDDSPDGAPSSSSVQFPAHTASRRR